MKNLTVDTQSFSNGKSVLREKGDKLGKSNTCKHLFQVVAKIRHKMVQICENRHCGRRLYVREA